MAFLQEDKQAPSQDYCSQHHLQKGSEGKAKVQRSQKQGRDQLTTLCVKLKWVMNVPEKGYLQTSRRSITERMLQGTGGAQ